MFLFSKGCGRSCRPTFTGEENHNGEQRKYDRSGKFEELVFEFRFLTLKTLLPGFRRLRRGRSCANNQRGARGDGQGGQNIFLFDGVGDVQGGQNISIFEYLVVIFMLGKIFPYLMVEVIFKVDKIYFSFQGA